MIKTLQLFFIKIVEEKMRFELGLDVVEVSQGFGFLSDLYVFSFLIVFMFNVEFLKLYHV